MSTSSKSVFGSPPSGAASSKSGDSEHECSTCHKSFASFRALSTHLRVKCEKDLKRDRDDMNYFSLKLLIDTGSEPFKKLYKDNASTIAQVVKTVQHSSEDLSDEAKLVVLRGQDCFTKAEAQKTVELFKTTGEEIK
jgi:hypothetical protein